MRVSTKGRYGLRILLDVALNQQRGPVALRDISRRQEISQKYLWQVINPLKAAGLINVTRGARGGYVLARSPDKISLREIVGLLEGADTLVECVNAPDTCGRSVACVAREAWAEVQSKLNKAMNGITLKDLLLRHHALESRGGPSYEI